MVANVVKTFIASSELGRIFYGRYKSRTPSFFRCAALALSTKSAVKTASRHKTLPNIIAAAIIITSHFPSLRMLDNITS
jgi:hypothetical protein